MVVIALTAEGIPAVVHATLGANRSTTVTALGYSRLATRCADVAVTGYVFDLAKWIHGKSIGKTTVQNISVRRCNPASRSLGSGLL